MRKLIATLLFTPCIASAEFETGNTIYQRMMSNINMDQMYALAYVAGVYDTAHSIFHCPPVNSNITLGQVHDMVKRHLETNPSIRNRFADHIIRDVLKAAWPCPVRNSKGAI